MKAMVGAVAGALSLCAAGACGAENPAEKTTATKDAKYGVVRADNKAGDFDQQVMNTLKQCRAMFETCGAATKAAPAVLVFPEVWEASLVVGGSGADGALVKGERIVGYYSLGGASAGFQAGVQTASEVFALNDKALAALEDGQTWKLGTKADITVVDASASARAVAGEGKTYVFAFNEEGLEGGVNINGVTVWERNTKPEVDDGDDRDSM